MLRIDGARPKKLEPTTLGKEELTEEHDLRNIAIQYPREVLAEDLLILGKEVRIPGLQDAVDILAFNKRGDLVIIELKRGRVKGDVDFQVLKYVSYLSRWGWEEINDQFEAFLHRKIGKQLYLKDKSTDDVSLSGILDDFCEEDYKVNEKQRVIIVGEYFSEKIGSVVLWLRDEDIDIRLIELTVLRNEDNLFLDSKVIVPTSSLEKFRGKPEEKEPWKLNPEEWHLKYRTNEETSKLLRALVDKFEEIGIFDEVSWSQKFYVAGRIGGSNKLTFRTRKSLIWIRINNVMEQIEDKVNLEQLANAISRNLEGIKEGEVEFKDTYLTMKCSPEQRPNIEDLVEFSEKVIENKDWYKEPPFNRAINQ